MKKIIIALFCSMLGLMPVALAETMLSVEQAFKLQVSISGDNSIVAEFDIAPGYHLYQDQIHFTVDNPKEQEFADAVFPKPQAFIDHDKTLWVFEGQTTIKIPFKNAQASPFVFSANYQGCSAQGVCYPPLTKHYTADIAKRSITEIIPITTTKKHKSMSEQDRIASILFEGNLLQIIIAFLSFGILLAFTPCVLPMVPIISTIIIGQKQPMKVNRAFLLSCTYVLGMAMMYATAGYLVGMAGSRIQAIMQSPTIIIFTSVIFVFLSLAMFDFYELKMPNAIQQRINRLNQSQKGGSFLGVFVMGALATLIISPCVSAPLVGALTYISQTGDALLGACALFFLAFGMGIPLILFGTFGSHLLPKSGEWMVSVKYFFGVVQLALAIWLLSRVIPGPVALLLWSMLSVIVGVFLGAFQANTPAGWPRFWQGTGILAVSYGIILLIGVSMQSNDPLAPLAHLPGGYSKKADVIERITSLSVLQQRLESAAQKHEPLILDFYADWCATCQTLEHKVFNDPLVQQAWSGITILKVDVTIDNPSSRKMQDEFKVFGPPALIFIGPDGAERNNLRLVGDFGTRELTDNISKFNRSLSAKKS